MFLDENRISRGPGGISASAATDGMKTFVTAQFWRWYLEHEGEVVLSIRVFKVIPVRLYVRDLRPVFVRIFGERHGAGSGG